jgi:hypothetical protein
MTDASTERLPHPATSLARFPGIFHRRKIKLLPKDEAIGG